MGDKKESAGDGRNYIWLSKKVVDRSDGRIIVEISVCMQSHEPFDKVRKAAQEDIKELLGRREHDNESKKSL